MIKIVKSICMDVETASRVNELVESGEVKNFSFAIQIALDSFLEDRK